MSDFFFLLPETMSSILSSKIAVSIAVLYVCNFTDSGSQIPRSFMSTSLPVSPSIPQVDPSVACFARSAVRVLIVFAPQFCANVLGIISKACTIALYGHCSTPASPAAFSVNKRDTAISTAPPPKVNAIQCKTY